MSRYKQVQRKTNLQNANAGRVYSRIVPWH